MAPRDKACGVWGRRGPGLLWGWNTGWLSPCIGHLRIGCVSLGNSSFLAEEESEGSIQKRKRKKRKKAHLQPAHLGSGAQALPPEQNGSGEPEGRAPRMPAAEPGVPAAPGPQEQGVSGPVLAHRKRKRPRKRSLRGQGEGAEATDPTSPQPLEDTARVPSPPADPSSGAPVHKRKRTLGALPVNGSGPPTLAWPSPQQEGRPAGLPPAGRLKKKKGEPSGLDLYNPSHQKTAVLKKRKKMKEMCHLVERSGVLKSEARLFQALVRQRAPARPPVCRPRSGGRVGTGPSSALRSSPGV